jgi:hypothetical protein
MYYVKCKYVIRTLPLFFSKSIVGEALLMGLWLTSGIDVHGSYLAIAGRTRNVGGGK